MTNTSQNTPSQNEHANDLNRRRRSSHRHHHSGKTHRNQAERERAKRKIFHYKFIFFLTPLCLILAGGIIWCCAIQNPDPSLRPKSLIKLSYQLLLTGGSVFALALICEWINRLLRYLKDSQKRAAEHAKLSRRRSSHRRHRSHSTSTDA